MTDTFASIPGSISLACCIAISTGVVRSQNAEPERPAVEIMMELSKAFRGLQTAAENGNADNVARFCSDLCKAAARIREVVPQENQDLEEEFARSGERLCELAAELPAAGTVTGPPLREVVASVRRACVTCHVMFRTENTPDRFYPARNNTIWGRIRILEHDGETSESHENVVVFLDGVRAEDNTPPSRNPVISQKGRRFTPRVLPVVRGTTVDFPNDDTIFHNVFSLSKPCCFDLDVYAKGTTRSVTFENPGLVKIYCNIHPDMVGNVLVLNNPYFAVSNSPGYFVITDIPDGDYTLRTWHEFGPETRTRISLDGGEILKHSIDVRETVKSIQHKNKFGKPYRDKYR